MTTTNKNCGLLEKVLNPEGRCNDRGDRCPRHGATLARLNAQHARLEAAWKLVDPTEQAGHWKAPVRAYLTRDQLHRTAVSLEDVVEAVAYFTGTEAKYHEVGGFFYVTAPGYWAGPCN